MLYKLPKCLINKLQKVQNNSARLNFKKKKREKVTPMLKSLHWLPIRYRIRYKVNLTTFKALQGMAPKYLKTLLNHIINPLASLRSASMDHLQEQWFTTNFGERSFSVSAPKLWNKLPKKIRDIHTVAHCKTALKEYYCTKAYLKRNASWDDVYDV